MRQNITSLIREAFLERVPRDGLKHTQAAEAAMNRFQLYDADLLKYMRYVQIEAVRIEDNRLRFEICPIHRGQRLRVTCAAEGHEKSNNVYFWVLSVKLLH
ncbi:MAG: hypothetical protein K6T83_16840 [Alicyclobacillus sp.]|nr:hypothetical protein [Alicyclobacillus sp.]